ncbi:MAG: Arc family DNA-binding protein [Chromatiaceae bacterium]|nr:Arc family DNA-binding protein [Chromatiaceae bacterium]
MYIRVPPELREAIERSAEENGRTMNGEIIFQMRRAYGIPPPVPAKKRD